MPPRDVLGTDAGTPADPAAVPDPDAATAGTAGTAAAAAAVAGTADSAGTPVTPGTPVTAGTPVTPGTPPAPASGPAPAPRRGVLRANLVTLLAGAVAVALAAVVWFGMPHDRDVESLGVLLFKLTPFLAAAVAIAWLDLPTARRLRLDLVLPPVTFLVFFCYFVPRNFHLAQQEDGFELLYYNALTMVPFVILSLVLAFRLGGGGTARTLRLAVAMLLLQLSGLEDLAYLTVNDHSADPEWTGIPEVWTWADHMTVFVGRPLTKEEAYVFIAVHVVLALAVLFLPARVLHRLRRRPTTA